MIMFDVDNVVLDFSKAFIEFMKIEKEKTVIDNTYDFGLGGDATCFIEEFYQTKYNETIPLIEPLISMYFSCRMGTRFRDYEFVTVYPPRYSEKRIQNFKLHKLDYRRLIFAEKKIEFIKDNRHKYDVIVDDNPKYIEALVPHLTNTKFAMPVRRYNQHIIGKYDVFCYNTFTELETWLARM